MYARQYDAQLLAADNKQKTFRNKPLAYALASAMAGFFIGLGLFFSQLVKLQLSAGQSGMAGLAASIAFSLGLLLVLFAGAELFTGNHLSLGAALFAKRIRGIDAVKMLSFCWLLNFAGAIALAVLFKLSRAGGDDLARVLLQTAAAKAGLSVTEMIVRGIFCNIFVCLAVWCCGALSSESGKTVIVLFTLSAFVLLGFEHCVANMSLFAYTFITDAAKQTELIGRSVPPLLLLKNLILVTIGNLIGGMGMVALPYHLMQEKA